VNPVDLQLPSSFANHQSLDQAFSIFCKPPKLFMRKIYFLLFAVFFWAVAKAQVSVTATAGTPGPTSYTSLSAAFAAVNAGTHQGIITIGISANTTEPGVAVLHSTGAGPALYTSMVIQPTADNVVISSAVPQGRGLIELNGADNVVINGDNPNSAGTNRNLTLQNTGTSTFTSLIRIALNTTTVSSANSNGFQNLILNGGYTGRNVAAANATTGTENTTFGILATGGAATADAVSNPAAITSVTTSIGSGATASNLLIENNSITNVGRAVSISGSATTVFPGLQISTNVIGNPVVGAADGVYSVGITVQGSTNAVVARNSVYVEGFIQSSAANKGIDFGMVSATGSGATIERNTIGKTINNHTDGWSAHGINIAGGTNHIVRNNIVINVYNNQVTGTGSFSTTFGGFGIRLAGGTGHSVLHNSVNQTGAIAGATGANIVTSMVVTATSITGVNISNNIFSNTMSGGSATTRFAAIMLPSGGTSTMNLTLNNNAYFGNNTVNNRMAQSGATVGTGEFTYAAFNAAATSPAANLRSYTSILSAAGTNDNASFGLTSAAPFVSATDLHIPAGTGTILESSGAAAGVTLDFDGDTRSATTPDIGADEFVGVFTDVLPPGISYTAPNNTTCTLGDILLNGVTITDASGVPTTGALVPRIYFRKNNNAYTSKPGTLASGTATNGSWNFSILAGDVGGFANGDVISYYIIAQDISATPNVASSPAGVVATNVNTVTTHPATTNIYLQGLLTGTYTVGTGGNFTTLTAAIAAYNNGCVGGPIVFELINPTYPSETYPVTINSIAASSSTNTLTIRPAAGVAATISGSNANTLIKYSGADWIIIDGVNAGGSSLTLNNTNAAGAGAIWIGTASASNGATNNIIRNVTFAPTSGTITGILAGSGTTLGGPAEISNNNLTIQGCSFIRAQNGIYIAGNAATPDQGIVITSNTFGSTTNTDKHTFRGLSVQNVQGFMITNNTIAGVRSTTGSTSIMTGISIYGVINGGTIANNRITDIKQINTGGFGANGIGLFSSSANANVNVYNNFISDIGGVGFAGAGENDNGYGIMVGTAAGPSGGGLNIDHNTVVLATNQTAAGSVTAAINIGAGVPAGGLNIRNNIFVNTQTVGGATRFAIRSASANTSFASIDNNDYFSAGTLGFIGSNRTDLPGIQAGFGGNTNSVVFQPAFVSATDLHLVNTAGSNWCLDGKGISLATVTTDIDAQARSNPPDIGADEFNATGLTITNPPTFCPPASADLTAPAITAGSVGGLTFTYFTNAAGTTPLANPSAVTIPGTYYIKATNGGCSLIRPVVVALGVNTNPVSITTQPTNDTVCAGQTAAFSVVAVNVVSYQWQVNNGSGFVNIPGATTAALSVSNVTLGMHNYAYRVVMYGICGVEISNPVLLKVLTVPTVSIVAAPLTSLQPNQVTTLYATYTGTLGSFAWYVNGQFLQTTTSPLLPNTGIDNVGDLTVVMTDANGCASAASNTITIKGDPSFEFWVYPVPNDGRFLVRFYSHTLGVKRTLRVWDAKGARVFEKEFTMNSNYERMDVDISKYTAGVYYVELRDANGQLGTSKVLVLK
jgi:hypothetical protein